ncbi:MAG TPA: SAM-dependent methyltransferase [Planctomycetes bacterium]|nr:SAM-dependent methyltransferase [Planctomycetota bacterium]
MVSPLEPAVFVHPAFPDHALLDSGGGEKLERFGRFTLVRPDPQAIWSRARPELWERADLVFERTSDRGGRWKARSGAPKSLRGENAGWRIEYRGAGIEIRPTPFKHVGLFPEQAANWEWIRERSARLERSAGRPRLLNLFGYTGVASVLAARSGLEVTHVDASRTSLSWMRDNMTASGLAPDAIRILREDALEFVRREVRRGARYEAVLLDPPHYGRGPRGEKWVFEERIAQLLGACARLLTDRSLLVLSSYAIGTSPLAMANLLGELGEGEVEAGELALPEEGGTRLLPCGFTARWSRG